jgi:hypothetical protein
VLCSGSFARVATSPHPLLPKGDDGVARVQTQQEATSTPELKGPDVPLHIAARFVDHYLDKLHNRPQSLFHPAKLRSEVQDGSINKGLLLAICCMGARFDHGDRVRSLETNLIDESTCKRLLLADLETICIENVQTCILIANLCAAHLNPSSEVLFFRR